MLFRLFRLFIIAIYKFIGSLRNGYRMNERFTFSFVQWAAWSVNITSIINITFNIIFAIQDTKLVNLFRRGCRSWQIYILLSFWVILMKLLISYYIKPVFRFASVIQNISGSYEFHLLKHLLFIYTPCWCSLTWDKLRLIFGFFWG